MINYSTRRNNQKILENQISNCKKCCKDIVVNKLMY